MHESGSAIRISIFMIGKAHDKPVSTPTGEECRRPPYSEAKKIVVALAKVSS